MARVKAPVLNSHSRSTYRPIGTAPAQEIQQTRMDISSLEIKARSRKQCPRCMKYFREMSDAEFNLHFTGCGRSAPIATPATVPVVSATSSPLSTFSRSPSLVSDAMLAQDSLEDAAIDDVVSDERQDEDGACLSKTTSQNFTPEEDLYGDNYRVKVINHRTAKGKSIEPSPLSTSNQSRYPGISTYVTTQVVEFVDGKAVNRTSFVMDDGQDNEDLQDESQQDEVEECIEDLELPEIQQMHPNLHDDGDVAPSPSQPNSSLRAKSKDTGRFKFKKLTPLEEFTDYLSGEMDFDERYARAANIAKVLAAIQDEYDELDIVTKTAAVQAKVQAKAAKDAEMLVEEAKLREEEPELLGVLGRFEEQLRQREKGWKLSLDQIHENGLRESEPHTYEILLRLRSDTKLKSDLLEKMSKSQLATLEAPRKIISESLPKLTVEDLRVAKISKRNYLQDVLTFDEKVMMDAYGLPYSASRRGNQDLRDRNAVDENGEALYENGRPKRSRAKRTVYDTENSGPPSPERDVQTLPAKRRRVQRNLDDAEVLEGEEVSRDATPGIRTFKSGKRVGRPPKSRLNEAHVPPAAGEQDDEDDDQLQSATESTKLTKSQAPPLEAAQENDLLNSVADLVGQTQSNGSEIGNSAVTKGKSKSTKSKKLEGKGSESTKARAGRGKSQSALAKSTETVLGDQLLESLEQDDQSRFASASTSRPTTASTHVTRSTLGSRANSQLREFAPSENETMESAIPAVSTRGKSGKRKLDAKNSIQDELIHEDEEDEVVGAHPKRRKIVTKKTVAAAPAFIEDMPGAAPVTKTKRKKAAAVVESIEVAATEEVADISQPSQSVAKKRSWTKPKGKKMKIEHDSDSEDEEQNPSPTKKQKKAIAKGTSSRAQSVTQAKGAGNDEAVESDASDDNVLGEEPAAGKKSRAPKQPKTKKASTRKGKDAAAVAQYEAELKISDPVAWTALVNKRAQKSAKLSASAKARWAKGEMKGPMEKRARTNAAKAAAKNPGSVATTPGPSAPPTAAGSSRASAAPESFGHASPQLSSFSQSVFQAAPQPPLAQTFQLAVAADNIQSPVRNSKRARKATSKAAAISGEGINGSSSQPPSLQPKPTLYEQILAIPNTPLGKRVPKKVFPEHKGYGDDDDEDDEDFE